VAHTIDITGHLYLERFGGGLLVIAGGLLAPLAARERRVWFSALAVAAGLVVWSFSFETGAGPRDIFGVLALSSTRYLLPVVAAAALGLALAASRPGRWAIAPMAALAASACINVVEAINLGRWWSAPAGVPALGLAAGCLIALAAARVPRLRAPWARPLAGALVVAVGAALAVPATGFLDRHVATNPYITGPVSRFLIHDPDYRSGAAGVQTTASIVGPLAGDRLQHRLAMLPPRPSCRAVTARARHAWLIAFAGLPAGEVQRCLGPPAFSERFFVAFRPTQRP
jgi:hypothetical protein